MVIFILVIRATLSDDFDAAYSLIISPQSSRRCLAQMTASAMNTFMMPRKARYAKDYDDDDAASK